MKTEGLLHQLAQTLTEGVAIVNNQGQLVFANRTLEQLLGHKPGALTGDRWTSLFPPELRNWAEGWRIAHPSKSASRYETRLLCKDGTILPVLVGRRSLSDGTQDLGSLLTFVDLKARGDLRDQVQQLEHMASMGQHLLSVVHELNNSLTILTLQSGLLSREGALNPSQIGDSLTVIQDQAKRMIQMVDSLRTSTDPHQPRFERVDINTLLRHSLELQKHQLQTEAIQVTTRLVPDLPTTQADPYKLEQVFVNLINNARQAMADVQQTGNLTVTSRCVMSNGSSPPRIQVQFTDNGPGISSEVMSRIFEPFFSTKNSDQGMGLGLSICNQIIRNHGGRIWAGNNLDGGATFVLELPVVEQVWQKGTASPGRLLSRHARNALRGVAKARPPILVVDDDPSLLKPLEAALT
jgi:PAS domain S-box-containing protein